jgi:3',5'-cyclic-AMP phosphodiesterase
MLLRKELTVILFLFLLIGCEKFEYSPYQTKNTVTPKNLNEDNINRLLATEDASDDTVTILITGDSQRFYDDLSMLVKKANKIPDIDFLLLAGDISDFSLLQEFLWINNRLKDLYFPYICVIGNHDLLANGSEIYMNLFGEKNFSFTYKGYKFIGHDTNSREYSFNGKIPDLPWLMEQLDDTTARWFIGISHVPPFSDDFDPSLEVHYKDLFASNPGFILSIHGHSHTTQDNFYYNDHVRYIITNAVEKKEFLILKLIDGKIFKELVPYSDDTH